MVHGERVQRANNGVTPEDVAGGDLEKLETLFDSFVDMNLKPVIIPPTNRVLGCLGTTAIAFFISCGGPIGSEPIVAAGGPLIGLLAFIVYPILITMPYAYIIAELCSAFPEDGGFVVWVLNSFGPFWGVQVGYWSWMSGIINNALLPSLLLSVLSKQFGHIGSPTAMWFLKAALAMMLALPSVAGARTVARTCVTLLLTVFVPFALFTVWGFVKADNFGHLSEVKYANVSWSENGDAQIRGSVNIDWNSLINSLFWNYDGINTISLYGGAIANPARVYARAISLTVALTMLTYVIPYPAAVASDLPHWSEYDKGTYPIVAGHIGGSFLQTLITLSSSCSLVGLYVANTFVRSYQLSGMAENQMVSGVFAQRTTRFNMPVASIGTTVVCTTLLVGLEYDKLLPMTNALSCATQIVVILSAIRLRIKLPYIPRPCKVPGGPAVVGMLGVLPAAVLVYMIVSALQEPFTAVAIGVSIIPGVAYGWYHSCRQRSMPMQSDVFF